MVDPMGAQNRLTERTIANPAPAFVAGALLLLIGVGALLGWLRQPRELRLDPPAVADLDQFRRMPNGISGTPPESYFALGKPYETDAYNLSQGKRLYTWFDCATCHGDGRGGAGPSFLDGWWLYGPEMVSIVASIRDGRPHGMPAFRSRMTIEQIWQLAGYVQTIGSYTPKIAAPSRNDNEHTRPAENRGPAIILFDEGPLGAHPDQGPSP
jgi:cytochrome c oxidase cbb3-type subunit III